MAKQYYLSRKNKKTILTVVSFLLLVFLMFVLIIPATTIAEVVEGANPTAWQSIHAWFTTVQNWLVSNFYLLAILGFVVALLVLVRKRR